MANNSNQGLGRALGAALGGLIGALGVALYLQSRRQAAPRAAEAPRAEAAGGIVLKPAGKPRSASVSLHADPDPLVRRQPVTIRAKAAPGAACTLNARYSTGHGPNSLDTGTVTADDDGYCEWTWHVGTTGSYVDITVETRHAGGETVTDEVRFTIVD